jgi:hypothetical protein
MLWNEKGKVKAISFKPSFLLSIHFYENLENYPIFHAVEFKG